MKITSIMVYNFHDNVLNVMPRKGRFTRADVKT